MQDSLRKPQQRTDTPLDFLLSFILPGLQQPQSDLRLPQPSSQPQPAPRHPVGQQRLPSPPRSSSTPSLLPASCPPRGAGRLTRRGQTPGKRFPACCPIPVAHSPLGCVYTGGEARGRTGSCFALEIPVLEQRRSPAARQIGPSLEGVIPKYQHLHPAEQPHLQGWLHSDRSRAGSPGASSGSHTQEQNTWDFFRALKHRSRAFCQAAYMSWLSSGKATPEDTYPVDTHPLSEVAMLQLSPSPGAGRPPGAVLPPLDAPGHVNL